jgi:hypothetical protein
VKRFLSVAIGIALICIIVLFIHSKPTPHDNLWTLESCKMTPRTDGAEYGDQRIVLHGPSTIMATQEYAGACSESLGTKFMRDGGLVCEWEDNAKKCTVGYTIEFETRGTP